MRRQSYIDKMSPAWLDQFIEIARETGARLAATMGGPGLAATVDQDRALAAEAFKRSGLDLADGSTMRAAFLGSTLHQAMMVVDGCPDEIAYTAPGALIAGYAGRATSAIASQTTAATPTRSGSPLEWDELIAAARAVTDERASLFDHDGGCQTHFGDSPCSMERLRSILRRVS